MVGLELEDPMLVTATRRGHREMMTLILDSDTKGDVLGTSGETDLTLSSEYNRIKSVRTFRPVGVNIDLEDDQDQTLPRATGTAMGKKSFNQQGNESDCQLFLINSQLFVSETRETLEVSEFRAWRASPASFYDQRNRGQELEKSPYGQMLPTSTYSHIILGDCHLLNGNRGLMNILPGKL